MKSNYTFSQNKTKKKPSLKKSGTILQWMKGKCILSKNLSGNAPNIWKIVDKNAVEETMMCTSY